MAAAEVVLRGAVTTDGRLLLEGEPGLPPGRVEVILRPIEGAARPGPPAVRHAPAHLGAPGGEGRPRADP